MATTHPIEVYVAHPDEVNEIFDLVSYNKGASVIRMMFDWLTRDVGFKGLHAYLTKFAYKCVPRQPPLHLLKSCMLQRRITSACL